MSAKALIIGDHPIINDVRRQFLSRGYTVYTDTPEDACVPECAYDDIVLLPSGTSDDNAQLRKLGELAGSDKCQGARVHLMVNSPATLTLIRRNGFADAIEKRFDINPFSLADEWSRTIRLDYKPITLQSEHRAHLVIFGAGDIARQIAINAALKSHFPNYTRDIRLRTRITVIDEHIESFADRMCSTYRQLFDHSHYRHVECSDTCAVTRTHKPVYSGEREDFVDVEWEFVKGTSYNKIIQEKLSYWASDPKQLLSIAIAEGTDSDNLAIAMNMPGKVIERDIPIYVWLHDASVTENIRQSGIIKSLTPIGMVDRGYDITTPLVEMGKTVNYIYNECYNDNMAIEKASDYDMPIFSVHIDETMRAKAWQGLDMVKRMSSIYNAMSIDTKLRSIGLEREELDKFRDLSAREINLLAEVEHNRWSVEELILGFRPCTDAELNAINGDLKLKKAYREKMIHYDLRSYRDLRDDITGKNVNIYDICLSGSLPLIAGYRPPSK